MQKPGNIAVIPNSLYINYNKGTKVENTPNITSLFPSFFFTIFQLQTKLKHVYDN